MKKVYIAGPYGASGPYDRITRNVTVAREAAAWLYSRGIGFYCPHTHTEHFEVYPGNDKFFEDLHLSFLGQCNVILLLPGWELSNGSKKELNAAMEMGLPVYFWRSSKKHEQTLSEEQLALDYEEGKW